MTYTSRVEDYHILSGVENGNESEEDEDCPCSSGNFATFALPKDIVDFKWELETYFITKK